MGAPNQKQEPPRQTRRHRLFFGGSDLTHQKPVPPVEVTSVTANACVVLSTVFLVVGLLGLAIPTWAGSYFSNIHNLFYLLTGGIGLGISMTRTLPTVRKFCFTAGLFFGVLGLIGFIAGAPGLSATADQNYDRLLLPLIPGALELRSSDHIFHLVMGALLIVAGTLRARNI